MSVSLPKEVKHKVAVIGGGITGCAFARQLLELDGDKCTDLTIFDWGRELGGRSSHRYRPEASTVDPDKTLTLHFDHGAQFLHVTNSTFLDMIRPAVQNWPNDPKRLGCLQSQTGQITRTDASSDNGFFGACDSTLDSSRYVGVGGMNAIAVEMLRGAKELAPDRIHVLEGTRVARCERVGSTWKLYGDGLGHEQANANALEEATEQEWGVFDELVITDHMAAAMPSWHPCHINGLEETVPELVSSVRKAMEWDESARRFRSVRPLFACMVALEEKSSWEFDAATIADSDVLQWICCQESRPHFDNDVATTNLERWVLVSTPEFAERCLGSEGMSTQASSTTGHSPAKAGVQYVPQSDEYLRADPADQMVQAFLNMVQQIRSKDGANRQAPKMVFRKCQRWGAAFTRRTSDTQNDLIHKILKKHEDKHSITLCGDFISELTSVPLSGEQRHSLVIQDAALSGIGAAERISAKLQRT